MKKFEEFCKEYLKEETETIDEASVVTFGGKTFPKKWLVCNLGRRSRKWKRLSTR